MKTKNHKEVMERFVDKQQ
jgi:hypothetical protein